jgi:predicted nuclease of predicted toxin-antitoxin system
MKILVDEHIPLMTVRALRLMGHDVHDIRGTTDEGVQDDALWAMAQQEERLLITTDKGFTQYRMARHQGVLIIRLRRPNRQRIHAHNAGDDAVFRTGMAWFISGHAGCCAEHLACEGEPLSVHVR